jgi:hypothetical protein
MKKISKPGKRPNPGWFKKGPDPKRNMGGNLNAALQSYEVRMKNSAAEKLPPEEFAEILADDVRHHRPGAREFWGKYIIGEPAQKHEVSGGIELHATWNGNGK